MRGLSGVICAAAACMIFSGCSAEIESGFVPKMNQNEYAEITVNGGWANFEALEAVAADWNAVYPNVSINYSRVDDYNNLLGALVTSENAPEIIMFSVDDYYANKSEIIDSLLDLSEAGLNTEIYSEKQLESSAIDGKMCVLNWGVRAPGFVVNKTLLDNLGLKVPQTRSELMNVCEKLKESGYTPIQGCSQSFYKNIMKNECDFEIFGSASSDKVRKTLSTAEKGCGECFLNEFETMISLTESGYISASANDAIADVYEQSILHFFEGQTPFLCFTTEGFSGMKKRESKSAYFTQNPFEYQFVALPLCENEAVLSISSFGSLAVVKNSENADWAKEFIRFVCRRDNINKMASTKGVPSFIENSESKYFSDIDKIPAEKNVICDYLPEKNAIDESFGATLYEIACGRIKTASDAQDYFENYLRKMVNA